MRGCAALGARTAIGVVCASIVQAQSIEWVVVGNPRNAPFPNSVYGRVDYVYQISRYEITNDQYAEMLNAKARFSDPFEMYNFGMATDPHGGITRSGSGQPGDPFVYTVRERFHNKPVNYVSWYDAMRFANWVNNGGGSGATETGTYTTRGVREPDGVARNVGARVFIPNQHEWFKAAYHDPNHPRTYRDTACGPYPPIKATANEVGDISNPGPNVANYCKTANWNFSGRGNVTTVGSAGPESESYYGTSDQTGNVWEWNEWYRGPGFRGDAGCAYLECENAVGYWSILNAATAFNEVPIFGFRLARAIPAGDMNCDAELNAFDIEPFVLALLDPDEYLIQHPMCDLLLADVNGDGVVDAFDIEPFVALLFP